MKSSQDIIKLLHSIQDVRLDADGEIEVKFSDPDPIYKDGWEPCSGYNHNSFTEQLLLLIQDSLNGNLTPTNDEAS